jgi:alcohol dehydrogenase class IV
VSVNLRALRERAPESPALPRLTELAVLLTGQADAGPEDAIEWLHRLTARLEVPGLAGYGLDRQEIPGLLEPAQRASSMRGNPIQLTDAEVAEIITRSL